MHEHQFHGGCIFRPTVSFCCMWFLSALAVGCSLLYKLSTYIDCIAFRVDAVLLLNWHLHTLERQVFVSGTNTEKWKFGLVSLISTHSIDFNWFELFSIGLNCFQLVWIVVNSFELFWIGLNCSDRAWSTSRGGWPAHCDAWVGWIQTTGFKGFKGFKRHVSKDSKNGKDTCFAFFCHYALDP